MAKNFVIIYTAREGSTAIVDALGRHPEISVPLLEELDRYWIRKNFQKNPPDVPSVMRTIFSQNRFDLAPDRGLRFRLAGQKKDQAVASVGFKWRPHGSVKRIASVFLEEDVSVFVLWRRDFRELVASLSISRHLEPGQHGAGHAQFRYAKLSDPEKAAYREKLETASHDVPASVLHRVMFKRCLRAIRLRRIADRFAGLGIPVRSIYYEDFRDDPDRFLGSLLDVLGVERVAAGTLLEGQKIQKVSRVPAVARIEGFREKLNTPAAPAMDRLYRRTIVGLPELRSYSD